jgi:alginate O-acetyltransferase complex protein AlgI
MNFISGFFLLFLMISLAGFYTLPRKYRVSWLLAASYVFYASWSYKFIVVILGATIVDYFLSHLIENNRNRESIKRKCLTAGILCNLAVLFTFKYLNFSASAISNLAEVLHLSIPRIPHFDLLLPLGISFYTFEAISYLVDVYRGQKPAKDLLTYNFYIMYFPHLISGPIVRFNKLARQYEGGLSLPSKVTILKGIELIVLGLAFKVLIANQVAHLVDSVYESPQQQFNTLDVWIANLAFSCQIYFDFMGYTHIARGVSLLFNIELPLNFRHPLNSETATEFWQRWHISLSSWIRDYLFIPLSKLESVFFPRQLIVILVMVVVGLWHGAGWTFAAFGLMHGVWLTVDPHISRFLRKIFGIKGENHRIYSFIASLPTFFVCVSSLVFFRARTLDQSMVLIGSATNFNSGLNSILGEISANNWTSVSTIVFLLFACLSGPVLAKLFETEFLPTPLWVRCTAAWLILAAVWVGASDKYVPFVYFQF